MMVYWARFWCVRELELDIYGLILRFQAPDGAKNVPVGKTIALLAEEGDDISNLEVPADEPVSSPKASQPTPEPPRAPTPSTPKSETPSPTGHHVPQHSRPLFPSVLRLIQEHNISQRDVDKISGTGVRGMLTKGDILTHLGLASGPSGTYHETPPPDVKTAQKTDAKAKVETAPLDGLALRRLVVSNMLDVSIKARAAAGAFSIYVHAQGGGAYAITPLSSPEGVDRLRLRDRRLPSTTEGGSTSCFCFGGFVAEASGCYFLRRVALMYLGLSLIFRRLLCAR